VRVEPLVLHVDEPPTVIGVVIEEGTEVGHLFVVVVSENLAGDNEPRAPQAVRDPLLGIRVRQSFQGIELLDGRPVAEGPLPRVPLAFDQERFLGRVVDQLERLLVRGVQCRRRLAGDRRLVADFIAEPREDSADGRHGVCGTEHPGIITHLRTSATPNW
jgi:hypothetical protein